MKLPRLLYFAEKKMKLVRRAFFSTTRLNWTHTAQRLDYCRGKLNLFLLSGAPAPAFRNLNAFDVCNDTSARTAKVNL